MITIVCDSGPIIHLAEAEALELLRNCGAIVIPEAVALETKKYGVAIPDWVSIRVISKETVREVAMLANSLGLHRGEAECIALTRDINAHWLATDDAAARYCAVNTGLEVHGTLGIVLYNAAIGRIDLKAGREILKAVRKGSLYISDSVFKEALAALERIGTRH